MKATVIYSCICICAAIFFACEKPKTAILPLSVPKAEGKIVYTNQKPVFINENVAIAPLLVADPATGTCQLFLRLANLSKAPIHIAYVDAQIALPSGIRSSATLRDDVPQQLLAGDTTTVLWEFQPTNNAIWWTYINYRGDFPPAYLLDLSFLKDGQGKPVASGQMQFEATSDSWETYQSSNFAREKGLRLLLPAPDSAFAKASTKCLKQLGVSGPAPTLQLRPEELAVGGVVVRLAMYHTSDSLYVLLRCSNQNDQPVLADMAQLNLITEGGRQKPVSIQVQSQHEADPKNRLIVRKGERFHALLAFSEQEANEAKFSLAGLLLAGPMKPIFCVPIPLSEPTQF